MKNPLPYVLRMTVYNFKIIVKLLTPVPDPPSDWFPLLANIYGTKTKSFDGYVSSVIYSDTELIINCYLVEDTDNNEKLEPLKARYSDWNGYQKISILDALKLHLRILEYNVSSICITCS
jgi:hypothetical protein